MARYCFYCGRELNPGEKCNCRQHRAKSSAPKSSAHSKKSSSESGHKFTRSHNAPRSASGRRFSWEQKIRLFFGEFFSRRNRGQKHTHYQQYTTGRNSSGRSAAPASAVARVLKITGSFLTRPAEQIRASQADKSQPVLFFVLLHSLSGGLLLLLATEQNRLADFLSLNFVTAQQGTSLLSRIFIFIQGSGLFLASFLLLVLLYQVVLRYLLRQSAGFLHLFAGLSPACLFSGIFLFFAALLVRSSFFSALLMLTISFVIHILVHSISLPALSGLDDNRLFIMIITVLLLFSGIIALILNLALPVIDALLKQVIII